MRSAMSSTETVPTLLICARCGAEFGCRPEGGCWCMDLPHDVALPAADDEGARCLCPDCLQASRMAAKG